jgi:hypothetical protein
MSTHQYTSGARTRNVINIVNPGGTTDTAYSLTAANSAPTSATHGYKNFHSQGMLHVLVHNNGLDDGGAVAIAANQITVYGYNSSLGGKWSPLRLNIGAGGGNTAQFPAVTIPDSIGKDTTYRIIVPIEGVERIAVHVAAIPTRTGGTLDIYLGVNSI